MKNLPHACFNVLVMVTFLTGCNSFIEVESPGSKPSPALVFKNDENAVTAVRGMYGEIAMNPYFNNAGIPLLTGLSADDFCGANRQYRAFSSNDVISSDTLIKTYCWQAGYRHIYNANAILEGLNASSGLTKATMNQLQAEALFVRAFCHFYLASLFGPVPLVTSTDLRVNLYLGRISMVEVLKRIESDLLESQQLLEQDKGLIFTKDIFPRSRANYWAVTAMLARLYLYQERWSQAEQQASRILEESSLFSLETPEQTFLSSSREAIWQLLPVLEGEGTKDAQLFLPLPEKTVEVYLTNSLINAFEPGDLRKSWIDSIYYDDKVYHFPAKYRQRFSHEEECHIEFRLAEVYLIRAEARIQQEDLSGARIDVDALRVRAGLHALSDDLSKQQLLEQVAQERRVELFAEGGHRWLDLKRTGQMESAMAILPYKSWVSTDSLYPIPSTEIQSNPRLEPQNLGY